MNPKIQLMTAAAHLAAVYTPPIPADAKPDVAEGIVATQVERWFQWLVLAYKDETVFKMPDMPAGEMPKGAPLVSALIAAIPGLDPATKLLLANTLGPIVQGAAGAVIQSAGIPLPGSSSK